ncbi:MAG: Crp/Fnr family transcriptional regulator [Nitrospiraceae bacterium]|nr:Crp/Fnr family transcriptional regulator [Nitrospiraceae bacterium]
MCAISHDEFVDVFRTLRNAPERLLNGIFSRAARFSFPAGKLIHAEGDTCSAIAFVLSGEIRVYKAGEGGREITLYEIGGGETCILTASCILAHTPYPANAVSVRKGEAVLVTGDDFRVLMATSEDVRRFIFEIMDRRLTAIMALVEEVAFERMDIRLREYLSEKTEGGVLKSTHHKIAGDLGTSREVVSRLLKDFEHKGIVALTRGEITLL